MRRVVLLAAIIALSATIGTTAGAQPTRSVNEAFTVHVGDIGNDNSCCVIDRTLEGQTDFSTLKRLDVAGTYGLVAHYDETDPGMSSELSVTFTSRNGDQFTIAGSSDVFAFGEYPPPAAWEIRDGTGHFAGLEGAGTYTIAGPADPFDNLDTSDITFTFTGSITK
jgi:hypothetical protein